MGDVEAGWYDDGSGRQRWWDGAAWSEHVVDMSGPDVELHSSPAVAAPGRAAGWFDDGRGRLRWWDGRQWGPQTQFTAEAHTFAGVALSGGWIHYRDLSQPVSGVMASFESGGDIGQKPTLARAIARGELFGPTGMLTDSTYAKRIVRRRLYLALDGEQQFWVVPVDSKLGPQVHEFIDLVNSAARQYHRR